jgi:hypothetical protein
MSNNPDHPCRLAVFLARKTATAVILRRGPSKHVEMISWYTRRDVFEYGQWFIGKVDPLKCDLSPDGQLFIYPAQKNSRHALNHQVDGYLHYWTALCRPPYFTAMTLWPHDGGGSFEDDQTIRLPADYQAHPEHPLPSYLKIVIGPQNTFPNDLYASRLQKSGWQLVETETATTAFKEDFRPRLWQKN